MRTTVLAAECIGVTKTYRVADRTMTAVDAVTCSIRQGMRLAITGPSGSGKSTLLHLIAGLETPSSGSVRLAGGVPGLVFQAPTLVGNLSVVENVALPMLFGGASEAGARAGAVAALGRLGIAELADVLPHQISGGQAQRAAIARVLASRPAMVLADEPTSQLDRATADRVATVLVEVCTEVGATLVVATHDPLVADLLDERWLLVDGALIGAGGDR